MTEICGLVKGPFRDEAAFKKAVVKEWERIANWYTYFYIESPEFTPGFPDVLAISNNLPSVLTEFKISDDKGVITFQKSQPWFYRRHPKLNITILAWDRRFNRTVSVRPDEVTSLRLKLPVEL